MSKPYPLSRPVLRAGAAEQVENALVVLRIDAPAIVGNLENRKVEPGPAAHRNFAGNSGLEVFECVVKQVGENLLESKAVAYELGKRLNANLCLSLRSLMRHGCDNGLDQFARVDPHGQEFASSLSGQIEDGRNQAVHFWLSTI